MSKKHRIKRIVEINKPTLTNSPVAPATTVKDSGKLLFWGTLGAIVCVQLIFSLNSLGQIRYEELAESVRNVFWLQNHTLYDGVSSNIGWYGSLMVIYNMFGFSLNTAKFFRLFLQILALLSIALTLKKYLSYKQSIIPLLAIGLSPTILYITTMQHSHGIDLQYAPICLYLLLSLDKSSNFGFLFKSLVIGLVSMLAWMSYPTFIFYLLPLSLLYLWQLQKRISNTQVVVTGISLSIIGALLPLIIGLAYLKDVQLALYDPVTKSGIFRGAGAFEINFTLFFKNLIGTFADLFDKGQSYHFELASGDFSNYYPIIGILVILGLSFSLFKISQLRIYIVALFLLMFSNLIISSFTVDPSFQLGLRRTTGALFALYALYAICWGFVLKHPFEKNTKLILTIILILIPLHHILTLPTNFIGLSIPSIYAETQWFKLAKTPAESLDVMLQAVQQDELKLGCKDATGTDFTACRYSEAYAAVAGYCEWNQLECQEVSGYDLQLKQQIPLSIDLWESYQIQH